ncbi:MAG TPA: hypothetical protein VGL63_15145 [Streptosporangiaceae bacterium]
MIIFGFLPQNVKMMAVAVAFSMAWRDRAVGDRGALASAWGVLAGFRGELYRCLTGRADAVLCGGG